MNSTMYLLSPKIAFTIIWAALSPELAFGVELGPQS